MANLLENAACLILDETAIAVVCTFSQAMIDWSKALRFDQAIIDESTVMHKGQLLIIMRDCVLIVTIGDYFVITKLCNSKII